MQNILIIKTGAAGDVVRTTCLLNILKGNIYWVVDPKNREIFPDNFPGLRVFTSSDFENNNLTRLDFDLVLSLEEDAACARLAAAVRTKQFEGILFNHEGLTYTPSSSGWYDMSLISKKGKARANELKKSNAFPFQHLLFKMLGKEFTDQPYVIYHNPTIKRIKGLVGIDRRVGVTWPNKSWGGYAALEQQLIAAGYKVKYFEQRESIRDYFEDIASCSCIISGDSLPMHVAMAYQIPCVAIFNCTPPDEIYNYGMLQKIVSPLLHSNLYSRSHNEEVVNSISVKGVFDAFKRLDLPK